MNSSTVSGKKVFRPPYIITGILIHMLTGTLFVWSYFRPYLMELFPDWTISQASLVFSVHNLFVVLGVNCGGFVFGKLSPRKRLYISGALLLIGLGGFALLPLDNPMLALWLAGIFYAAFAASGIGLLSMVSIPVGPRWAPECPGLMMGAMQMAYGGCPILLGGIASRLVPVLGTLNTICALGVIVAIILLIISPFAKFPSDDTILPPAPVREENKNRVSYSFKEVMKMPAFWAVFIFNTVMRANGLTLIDHAGVIAVSFGTSALFGLLYSPAVAVGAILSGFLADKIGVHRTMIVYGGGLSIAGALLIFGNLSTSAIIILVGLVAGGLCYGGNSAVVPTALRILFGEESFEKVYSIVQCAIIPACIICMLNGVLVDKMGGTYGGIFIVTLVLSLIAFTCGLLIRSYVKKQKDA